MNDSKFINIKGILEKNIGCRDKLVFKSTNVLLYYY